MPPLTTKLSTETDATNQSAVTSLTSTPVLSFTAGKNSKVHKQRPNWTPELVERLRKDFVPPDGGYAWLIVAGAFVVQFWVAGLIKSYGVIYLEVLQLFPDANASLASWIPAMLATLWMLSSPIVSGLCERFTCRAVVFVGGVCSFLGLILSFFTTSLVQLCFSFGVLGGIGAGLSTTPGIIMASRFFTKRRALANGICISGTAAGSIVLPPLVEFLVPRYGFHGTLLILGACMLHVFIAACLYRPYELHQWIQEINHRKFTVERNQLKKDETEIFQLDPVFDGEAGVVNAKQPDTDGDIPKRSNSVDFGPITFKQQSINVFQYVATSETNLQCSEIEGSPPRRNDSDFTNTERDGLLNATAEGGLSSAQFHRQALGSCVVDNIGALCSSSTCVHRGSIHSVSYVSKLQGSQCFTAASKCSETMPIKEITTKSPSKGCSSYVRRYIDITLLKNPLFMLIALTVLLMGMGCPHALFYVPAHVNSLGYSKGDAGLLLSISAVFDFAGRLITGYIADLKLFRNSYGCCSSMAMAGIAVLCLPWVTSYWVLGIIVSVYGYGLGAWFLYIPVLMAEHHGTQAIGSSYGLVRLFQGIAALTVPPFSGFLKDVTGSYVPCFLFMGCAMLTGAFLTLLEPCAKTLAEKRKLRQK